MLQMYTVSGTRNRYIFSPRCNSHVKTSISTPPKAPTKVQEDSEAMVGNHMSAL